MRYEKPELALLGAAHAVVLGGDPYPPIESVDSHMDASLYGYDE